MTYTLIKTDTKPGDAVWYGAVNTEVTHNTISSLRAFVNSAPGLTKFEHHTRDNANVSVNTYIFDNGTNANAFKDNLLVNTSFVTINDYNVANGITSYWHRIRS